MEKLTLKQVQDLGFSTEEIANVKFYENYLSLPHAKFFDTYKPEILYNVIEGKLYVSFVLVEFNGFKFAVYIHENWDKKYVVTIYNEPLFDKKELARYEGTQPKAFNKNTIDAMMLHYSTEFTKYKAKYIADTNSYDKSIENFIKKGFVMHGKWSAYYTSPSVIIKVDFLTNGNYQISEIRKGNKVDNDELLDKLLSI